MRVWEREQAKGIGNRKAAELWAWWSAEKRGRKSERSEDARKKEVIMCLKLKEKATEWNKMEEGKTRLVNMITTCAAAHPCVELVYSDNRVHWGTLFMLSFDCILRRKQKNASTELRSAKSSVFCICGWLYRGVPSIVKVISSLGFSHDLLS